MVSYQEVAEALDKSIFKIEEVNFEGIGTNSTRAGKRYLSS